MACGLRVRCGFIAVSLAVCGGTAIAQAQLPPRQAVSTTEQKESRYLIERIQAERDLEVIVGQPTILRFRVPPFRDQVGDPEVATMQSISESEISVTGKRVGSTTINLWFRDADSGQQEVLSYRVRVKEDPEEKRQYEDLLSVLELDINRNFLGSVVDLSYVGSQVVVRGKAKDVESATSILRIVSESLPDEELEEGIRSRGRPRGAANASSGPKGSGEPGSVTSFQSNTSISADLLEASAVQSLSPQELIDSGGLQGVLNGRSLSGANAAVINNRIVNMLEIAGIHQVMLKVTLAEVVRDSGRSLISNAQFGVDSNDSQSRQLFGGNGVAYNQQLGIGELTFQSNQFFLQLDALKRLGLARSLSEPNLTTLSGQPATFLVGGQFPVTTVTANDVAVTETIQFVPFGVQLAVLPTVTDGDRIRLQLLASVSETVGTAGDNGNGNPTGTDDDATAGVPSLSTRQFNSTVELRDGESLALAGLIRTSVAAESSKVPFLGDLPVIGGLMFSDRTYNYSEQELMVVVTPHLVTPLPRSGLLPVPGSDTFEPDDLEFYLRGSIEGSLAEDYRTPVRGSVRRMESFRRCEQKYIIGAPGHSSGRPLPGPRSSGSTVPNPAVPSAVEVIP